MPAEHLTTPAEPREPPAVEAHEITRRFGDKLALERVSVTVSRGEIHALLGPNGAGKTTLLRIVAGLMYPTEGSVGIFGLDAATNPRAMRQHVGLVPSGDRSFYLRISGLENLVFFARLYGMRRRHAVARALGVLEQVGLRDVAGIPVGVYSHGMQKRLSIARALLADPTVLLCDEATHDLDPDGARTVRELVAETAGRGAAVIWSTQRIEEIRSFADRVTVLGRGRARFSGTVPELAARAMPRRWLLGVRNGGLSGASLEAVLRTALAGKGTISPAAKSDPHHYVLALADGVVLGDALSSLLAARIEVLACREERPEVEEAFLSVTSEPA